MVIQSKNQHKMELAGLMQMQSLPGKPVVVRLLHSKIGAILVIQIEKIEQAGRCGLFVPICFFDYLRFFFTTFTNWLVWSCGKLAKFVTYHFFRDFY